MKRMIISFEVLIVSKNFLPIYNYESLSSSKYKTDYSDHKDVLHLFAKLFLFPSPWS